NPRSEFLWRCAKFIRSSKRIGLLSRRCQGDIEWESSAAMDRDSRVSGRDLGREPLWQAMAFKELPHHLSGVDFLSRPGVAQPIDTDHSDLYTVAATGVAHRRQGPGGIFQNDFGIAAIVTSPARKGVRNTFQPLVAAAFCPSVIWILWVGQSVECQDRYGPPGAGRGPTQSGYGCDGGDA